MQEHGQEVISLILNWRRCLAGLDLIIERNAGEAMLCIRSPIGRPFAVKRFKARRERACKRLRDCDGHVSTAPP